MPGVPASVRSTILQANSAFYRAFSEGDAASMIALWARQGQLVCAHPGAPLLVGRDAVLESWRSLLRRRPGFVLRCDDPNVGVFGETAIVTCYEAAGDDPAHLAATNVFVLEDGVWRMVHHHAGPLSTPIPNRSTNLAMN